MTSRKEDNFAIPPKKKLRFRGDLNLHHFDSRIEDILDDDKRSFGGAEEHHPKGAFFLRLLESIFVVSVCIVEHRSEY